jgi:hypothetical protein
MRKLLIALLAFLTLVGTSVTGITNAQTYPPRRIAISERHPMIS